jgi:TetR/AcrR family transcriptional regulator, fatty acid metabolism regulator protein
MARSESKNSPPGRIKIIQALRTLLEEKNFDAVKTAEIASLAGVAEGLIYKHFRDKRDLLYEVLREHFERFLQQVELDLKGIEGSLNKLRKIIWSNLHSYANHKVFARIVLLEVRNSPGYFESSAYEIERRYNRLIINIIHEGIRKGEIRKDVKAAFVRSAINGSIENACLQGVIFNRSLSSDEIAENICNIVFDGIKG